MENYSEKTIKKFSTVYLTIVRKVYDRSAKISAGGKTAKMLKTFVDEFIKKYGSANSDRITDYCISLLHYRFGGPRPYDINMIFGKTALTKYESFKIGKQHFENEWLKEYGLERSALRHLIADKTQHSLTSFIYIEAEDVTKHRACKLQVYMNLCSRSTTMWTPFSPVCKNCKMSDLCAKETNRLFPELFRIRKEKWQATK